VRKGFTLLEIAIAIATISILAYVAARVMRNYSMEAKASRTLEFARKVSQAVNNYFDDVGGFPSNAQRLWKNPGVKGWYGAYVEAPYGNVNYNYFPRTPMDVPAYLECSSSYLRLKFSGASKTLCQLMDKKGDDNNLTSGRVRYENGNCYYYLSFSDITCK